MTATIQAMGPRAKISAISPATCPSNIEEGEGGREGGREEGRKEVKGE